MKLHFCIYLNKFVEFLCSTKDSLGMFIIEAFVIVFLKSAGPPVLTGMQICLLREPNVGVKNIKSLIH
jgi:ATP/ADP translocase